MLSTADSGDGDDIQEKNSMDFNWINSNYKTKDFLSSYLQFHVTMSKRIAALQIKATIRMSREKK